MENSYSDDESRVKRRSGQLPTFLTGTTLTFLKPKLKGLLYPAAALLARIGITANHVTLTSLAGLVLSGNRRIEGPLGKADRSIVLLIGGAAVFFLGVLPNPI